MEPRFKNCDRDSLFLMPPSVDDWVAQDHLARFVLDIVSRLDAIADAKTEIEQRAAERFLKERQAHRRMGPGLYRIQHQEDACPETIIISKNKGA